MTDNPEYTPAERAWYTATVAELGGIWRLNSGARHGFVPYCIYLGHIATIWPADDYTTWDVVVRDLHGQLVAESKSVPSATDAYRAGGDMLWIANGEGPISSRYGV